MIALLSPPSSINSFDSESRQLTAPIARVSAHDANAAMSTLIAPSEEPLLERMSAALRIESEKAPLTFQELLDHLIV